VLRYVADVRALFYLALTIAISIVQWRLGHIYLPLYALSLFMAVTVAVISHNHNHLGMWKSRVANLITTYAISIYYGLPATVWVPTHNQNHHKYNNGEGDHSKGPRFFTGNHLLSLLVYPPLTGIHQMPDISNFIKELRHRDRKAYWAAISEYAVLIAVMLTLFLLNARKALLFFLIPQLFSQFVIQIFNYVQHVEAETGSEWNHSRNFVSPVLNALLFNNGYHTVHHYKPGVHWSQTPKLHAEHASKIDPELQVKSWWAYMTCTFLLRPFVPSWKAPVFPSSSAGERAGHSDLMRPTVAAD
jgi:beta-carotene hydroxylase